GCHMRRRTDEAVLSHDGTTLDPYGAGTYFADTRRHEADAAFKAEQFLRLFKRTVRPSALPIHSYADVGTGSGDAARLIGDGLRRAGYPLQRVKGYDVSPHAAHLRQPGIEYFHADFARAEEQVDLVTLLDVFEHVTDALTFLKNVAARCHLIGFHIPLDDSLNVSVRD